MRHPENAERWVRAYWDTAAREQYSATLELTCMDRANLVSDIALALGDMRVPSTRWLPAPPSRAAPT